MAKLKYDQSTLAHKAVDVIESCKTIGQLNVACNYVNQTVPHLDVDVHAVVLHRLLQAFRRLKVKNERETRTH